MEPDTQPEQLTNPEEHKAAEKQERKPRAPRKQKPAVGRIIHVVASADLASKLATIEGQHLAAIITGATRDGWCFNATVFSPVGNQPVNGYPLSAACEDETGREGHTWHWPERD